VLFVMPSFRCMIYVSSGFDLEPVLSLRHNSLIRTRMRIGRVSIAQHLRCGRFFHDLLERVAANSIQDPLAE
jgi:hypothetical protein